MEEGIILRADGITKAYRHRTVLSNASLSLKDGAALCLFGPNGSGKSTLLDILALAARPDSGSLVISDTDALSNPGAVRGSIGYAPQDIALFEELTVAENLLCWSKKRGAEAKSDAESIMEKLLLTTLSNKRIRELSGGMKRRANLAAALLGEPELLILDEPFAGMDFENIENTLELLSKLKAGGTSLLLSDHSTLRPLAIMDSALVLRDGITAFYGSREMFLACGNGADDALRRILSGDAP